MKNNEIHLRMDDSKKEIKERKIFLLSEYRKT